MKFSEAKQATSSHAPKRAKKVVAYVFASCGTTIGSYHAASLLSFEGHTFTENVKEVLPL